MVLLRRDLHFTFWALHFAELLSQFPRIILHSAGVLRSSELFKADDFFSLLKKAWRLSSQHRLLWRFSVTDQ